MPEDNQSPSFSWPLIGHQNIVSFLQKSIMRDRLTHAYLFVGPEHLGKTTLAEYFVASLYCYLHSKSSDERLTIPCQKCIHCQELKGQIHPDIFRIGREENKKNVSIASVRDLISKLQATSFLNSYKIGLIYEAESLTEEAANALLKTLEEPTRRSIIILIAQNIFSLPPTIISRSQVLKFLPVSDQEIYKYLLKEKHCSSGEAEVLTHLSYGRPGLALNFLENGEEGLENWRADFDLLFQVMNSPCIQRFKIVKKIISKKINIFPLLDHLSLLLRDLILIKEGLSFQIINLFLKIKLFCLAEKYSEREIIDLQKRVQDSRKYLKQNVNPQLVLENFVLSF